MTSKGLTEEEKREGCRKCCTCDTKKSLKEFSLWCGAYSTQCRYCRGDFEDE